MSSILSIFVIAIIITPIFSTAPAAPERSFNCYKYEKSFPDLNIIDPPAEEKDVVKCDQCFSYLCYSKKNEYTFGYGCRDDFFKTCHLRDLESRVLDLKTADACYYAEEDNAMFDMCLKDYCSHKNVWPCIKQSIDDHSQVKIGPKYTAGNITFTQLTTPAPTTTTTTTTPVPTTKSAFNVDSQSDKNNPQNGENGSQSGSQNEKSAASNNLVNYKMLTFLFFGIFMVAYFM